MILIRKQNGFDDFVCIADKCPKSCCIGWQIEHSDENINALISFFEAQIPETES